MTAAIDWALVCFFLFMPQVLPAANCYLEPNLVQVRRQRETSLAHTFPRHLFFQSNGM